MRTTMRLMAWVVLMMICTFVIGSPLPGKNTVPYAPDEALEDFKKAVAFLNRGCMNKGMPNLWLLNAYEGETRWVDHPVGDIPGKIVNFLCNYAHLRDVYAACLDAWSYLGCGVCSRD